ncbi:MAG: helix-turn-helix domain-containing protein [Pseudoclavibacter sp.]
MTRSDDKQPLTLDELRASKLAVLSRQQVADILGVDPRTVSAGVEEGNIPALKIGRRVLIPRDRFLALFDVRDEDKATT